MTGVAISKSQPCDKPPLLVVQYANPDYYPPTVNAVSLIRKAFEVHLICRNADPPTCEWPANVEVERVGGFAAVREKEAAGPLAKLREFTSFVRAVARRRSALRPRLIYAYDIHALAAVFMSRREPNGSCPLVYQAHDQPEMEALPLSSLQTWIARYAMRKVRRAAMVVYPEKHRAQYYMQVARDPRPPVVVPNCASRTLVPFNPDLPALIERRWRDRQIIFTGTIGKGVGVLDAVRALASLDIGARLRLFGPIPEPAFSDEIRELARALGLADRVSLEGWVPLESLVRHTMDAALGLVLYVGRELNDTFIASATNKLFEYAARGIPAVVPDNQNFREFLEGESWVAYADPASPQSLAAAIRTVFADRERYSAMCRAARRAFEEKYNYERVFAPVLERMLALTADSRRR
ncbi:MAG: glycosyltransferase [Candidatus Binataceae bacterium]